MTKFFFDTYAIMEIISGNENYKKYMESDFITTKLNLMELYYQFIRENEIKRAEYYYQKYLPNCIEISDKIIKEAMKFKYRMNKEKKNISYVDAIGYTISENEKIKFLTGDIAFKDVQNVEYVK